MIHDVVVPGENCTGTHMDAHTKQNKNKKTNKKQTISVAKEKPQVLWFSYI